MCALTRPHNELLARFRCAVQEFPRRTAVAAADGTLTFADLDDQTRRLAAVLVSRGVTGGDRVGICLGRGTRLVVALLAVWRAGAAYVPLDPEYPDERVRYMAGEVDMRALIAERHPDLVVETVVDPNAVPESEPPAQALDDPAETDAAYVIFTSGSSGRPKGVEVTHGAVASLVSALDQVGAYGPEPRVVGWNASVAFDASVQQWVRVCRGDTLVVLSADERMNAGQLGLLLERHRVDDLDLTPSHWEFLKEALLARHGHGRTLRLFMGGEPVPEHTWRELADAKERGALECLNLYGPTECTVDATTAWIEGARVHIGTALPDTRLYVLDDDLRQVPVGVEGELFIAGPRVARGYVNRPALTAGQFVADPFGAPGARMYRTGDQVRRRADDTFEYLGRRDRQVKVRGHRIEPGEVEAVLGRHPDIATARTVLRTDGSAAAQLVAYVVPSGNRVPEAELLRKHVGTFLPKFMVPSAFVPLAALPLTPNGKLDESALPAPREVPVGTGKEAEPPRTGTEALVADVWSGVLEVTRVGREDDFFALGGHSLTAIRATARLKKNLGLALTTKDLYRNSRLSAFAARIESLRAEPEDAE